MSLNIAYFLNLLILEIWIRYSDNFEKTFKQFNFQSFQKWKEYMQIGLFGAILECLGWWNLNIVFLFAGYLSVTSIAA